MVSRDADYPEILTYSFLLIFLFIEDYLIEISHQDSNSKASYIFVSRNSDLLNNFFANISNLK